MRLVAEKQLEEAESTIDEGTLKNVLKMPLNLFNKQLVEVTYNMKENISKAFFREIMEQLQAMR